MTEAATPARGLSVVKMNPELLRVAQLPGPFSVVEKHEEEHPYLPDPATITQDYGDDLRKSKYLQLWR